MEIITQSIITCPVCGYQKMEEMPQDACQFYYECTNCHTLLRPSKGDCCDQHWYKSGHITPGAHRCWVHHHCLVVLQIK
jgi:hypothetical protein